MSRSRPPCIYVIGTDTDVGKTAFTCAVLLGLQTRGLRVLPQKPAASGPDDASSDLHRLLAATPHELRSQDLCSFRSLESKAPGLISDACAFLPDARTQTHPPRTVQAETTTPTATSSPTLQRAVACLHQLISQHDPTHVLIEAAGGWHVPMPEGTWQSAWIEQLSDGLLLVARPGLGTINHTLLTIQAARAADPQGHRPILGFVFSSAQPERASPSTQLAQENAAVIESRSGVPFLGTLPFVPALSDAQRITADRERLIHELGMLDVMQSVEHALRRFIPRADIQDDPATTVR